jgi:molybdenum cofactor biosynthesis enzyme MoaA
VVACRVAPLVPVAGETRELGVMLRDARLFDDAEPFELERAAHRNLALNQAEFRIGQTVLESVPPAIRVNLQTRCNIPETSQACAYCAWDWAKESERGAPAFTPHAVDALGDFYRSAAEVNDCSIGEPTMARDFDAIVSRFDRDGKRFSLTTNGQLLTPARRSAVVGKNVSLYVSLDSATAAGYARYRNNRFDEVVANVAALCREKKAHGGLPRVYLSFIAMRSNVDELPEFFALASAIGVDEVKLRLLYLDDNLPAVTINNGYRFDYAAEVLTMAESASVADSARRLACERGVALYVESDQFASGMQAPAAPLCSEPWQTVYVLARGVMPCCYATEPIARWSEQQDRPLETFLRDVFNGPAYQEIRRELAAGRLADYCRNTPSCPFLKDMLARGEIATDQNEYQRRALPTEATPLGPALPLVPLAALNQGRAA